MNKMIWDQDLADAAQEYVESCELGFFLVSLNPKMVNFQMFFFRKFNNAVSLREESKIADIWQFLPLKSPLF